MHSFRNYLSDLVGASVGTIAAILSIVYWSLIPIAVGIAAGIIIDRLKSPEK